MTIFQHAANLEMGLSDVLPAAPTPGSNIDGKGEFFQDYQVCALEGDFVSPFPGL